MFARWPEPFSIDEHQRFGLSREVAREVAARYGMIKQLRNLRTEHKIPSNKKVRVVYHHMNRGISDDDWATLRQLGGIQEVQFVQEYQPSKGEPVVYPPFGGKLFLPLAVDVAAERERLDKEIAKIEYLPVFTLDAIHQSFNDEYQFVFFMSVDVEGYDYEVLSGGKEMLSNTLFLCVEANDAESEKKITELLNHFQFILEKKVKVNLFFKNTRTEFDRFLKHNNAKA